jgi:hypothetical protein
MTDDEIAGLASTEREPAPPSSSALDYVRTVLGSAPTANTGPALPRMAMASPMAFDPSDGGTSFGAPSVGAPSASTTPPPEPPSLERSQWERLSLGPNVELHIRRPLSRHEQRRIDRLITIARQVLKEGQP